MSSSSRLDTRDDAIKTLYEIITCPILQDTSSSSMCIFNSHCYDYASFDHFRMLTHESNIKRQDSGHRDRLNLSKDPRTGEYFDYNDSMNTLYHRMLTKPHLQRILVNRVAGLTMEESDFCIPTGLPILQVQAFVNHVKYLYSCRKSVIKLYEDVIKSREAESNRNLPVQVVIPTSYVAPPSQNADANEEPPPAPGSPPTTTHYPQPIS